MPFHSMPGRWLCRFISSVRSSRKSSRALYAALATTFCPLPRDTIFAENRYDAISPRFPACRMAGTRLLKTG
jgi:hypothetical protein